MELENDQNYKICTECNEKVLKTNLGKKSAKCKKCLSIICKNYRIKNKEKYKIANKLYQKKNKDKIKEFRRKYDKERKQKDDLYKLKCNIRSLISISFNNKNMIKNSKTVDILGCDYEFFRNYIKAQFNEKMNWNNIHLDHIKPLSTASTKEEVLILNHYTNFQPLLVKDNLVKNNKIIEKQLRLI